jgi:hypothetical protein
MERRYEIRQEEVAYVCDACREGEMLSDGFCLTSNPPQYPHRCNRCGHMQTFDARYPFTRTSRLNAWTDDPHRRRADTSFTPAPLTASSAEAI